MEYNARFRAQSNYMSRTASPFGDPDENSKSQNRFLVVRGHKNQELHARWRRARNRATGSPFGDPQKNEKSANRFIVSRGRINIRLHDRWREARVRSKNYTDTRHPFIRQGKGKAYTYKLFLEVAHTLCGLGGRMGVIVPSGLYSDNGTSAIKDDLFLQRCRWEWLFGIENRDKVFPIDSRFKFNPVIVEKGGTTEAIRTTFMRRNLDDWERAEELTTSYSRAQVEQFSPRSRAILEIQSKRDLEILEKIYANSVLLGDDGPDGWGIRYSQGDFNMTSDSHLFPPRPRWEAKGYRPDEYSRWLLGDWRPIDELWQELGVDPSRPEPVEIELEDWLFDTTAGPERREAEAQFVHGHLLKPGDVARTDWCLRCAQPPYDRLPIPRAKIPAGVILSREGDAWIRENTIEDTALPLMQGAMLHQFDFSQKGWVSGTGLQARWQPITWANKVVDPQFLMSARDAGPEISVSTKIAFRRVARNTDVRTMIAGVVPRMPCGDKASVLKPISQRDVALLTLVLNSFGFDTIVRLRVGATQVDYHYARELPLFIPDPLQYRLLTRLALGLNCASPIASPSWCIAKEVRTRGSWKTMWTATEGERVRRRVVSDALISCLQGLDAKDLHEILKSCDHHEAQGNVKGFWRIDKNKDPELRHTVLTLIAFHDLDSKIQAASGDPEKGIEAFLAQNHGEGWMLPETLCLANYGLGHDERAQHPNPVASRLGPRFYAWQLVQSADESWRECHLHARNILGPREYARLIPPSGDGLRAPTLPLVADRRAGYGESRPSQKSLFTQRTES